MTVTQALDFHNALTVNSALDRIYQVVRNEISFAENDRFLCLDIRKTKELLDKLVN